MSDRTLRAYERWAATYDLDPNPHTTLERPWVLELLALSHGELILDAACGTGFYAARCVGAGSTVTGVDLSPAMLAAAKQRVPLGTLLLTDLNDPLPFPDDHFDGLVCAQALKHLPDLEPPLAEFFRVLKPGGRCVVSVTHPEMDWHGYVMREEPSLILSAEADIYPHQRGDYESAFSAAGFAPVEWRSIAVDDSIRHLLTEQSFRSVVGRPQIAIVRAWKPQRPQCP